MNKTKARIINSIERTGNPMAPIIIQKAHSAVEALGKLMATEADKQSVEDHCKILCSKYLNMNITAADPNFVIALCSLLATSIEFYIKAEGPPQKGART